MKVRILSVPKEQMALGGQPGGYGGQAPSPFYSLNTGARVFSGVSGHIPEPFATTDTLKPAEDGEANIEAEKGETLVRQMPDGNMAHFDIGGKPHSQGGEKIEAHTGDFIFPVTKSMALAGPILENFGKSKDTKKKYPTADLAKQYEINKWQAIVHNPDSNKLSITTAQRNIDNSLKKLQELAIVTEAKKGFPQGIPEIGGMNTKGVVQVKYGGKYQYGGNPSIVRLPEEDSSYNAYIRKQAGNNPNWNANPWRIDTGLGPVSPVEDSSDNPEWSWNGFMPVSPNVPISSEQLQQDMGAVPAQTYPEQPQYVPQQHPGNPEYNKPKMQRSYGTTKGEKMAKLAALYQLANTQRYSPYAAPIPYPMTVQPILGSAEREIAALQENANSQQQNNAMFQSGARQRSIGSSIEGQLAPAIGNALARTNAGNVDILNRANAQNAEILNRYNAEQANRLTGLHAAGNELDSKYRDAINARLKPVSDTTQAVESNVMHRDLTNAMNPNYEYIPGKGIRFRAGMHNPFGASAGSDDIGAQVAHHAALIRKSNPNIDPDAATKMAFSYIMGQHYKNTTSPSNPKRTTNQQSGTPGFGYGTEDYTGYGY